MLIIQFTALRRARRAFHLIQFLKKAEYGSDLKPFQETDMREGEHV